MLRSLSLPDGTSRQTSTVRRPGKQARWNKRDYDDTPEEVRNKVDLVWLEKVDDAVAAGLQPGGAWPATSRPAGVAAALSVTK